MEHTTPWLDKLKDKYERSGQSLDAYLEGLYHARPITYWDYIHLDTLLSLQQPRTFFPDEKVFIMYHQVTELYFKMALSEYEQIADDPALTPETFAMRVGRINRYFDCLGQSFSVMTDGMSVEQYRQFRMSLTPASGFQSAQYRIIELCSTDLRLLVDKRYREQMPQDATVEEMMSRIYWQAAGIDHQTGRKSETLRIFEEKYLTRFLETAHAYRNKNLRARFRQMKPAEQEHPGLREALRNLDHNINVRWPLNHYHAALTYLSAQPVDIEATGGSDWRHYLHPKFQRRIFFPELWSEEELNNWGRMANEE